MLADIITIMLQIICSSWLFKWAKWHGDIDVLLNIIPDLYSNKTKVLIHVCSLTHFGS